MLEVAKLRLRRREELLADLDVRIHRSADVQKQKYVDPIATLRLQSQIEPAGVACRAADRPLEVELVGNTFARETAQPAQRNLDVARVELDIAIEVAKRSLVPHPHRAARAAICANANAFGIETVGAEPARATRTDPFTATLVPLALLGEASPETRAQRATPAQCFRRAPALIGQVRVELAARPLVGDLAANSEHRSGTFEIAAKGYVEAVEMLLVLDETSACEHVEIVERARHDACVERLEQRQEFARRYRQAKRLQMQEEANEHRSACLSAVGRIRLLALDDPPRQQGARDRDAAQKEPEEREAAAVGAARLVGD